VIDHVEHDPTCADSYGPRGLLGFRPQRRAALRRRPRRPVTVPTDGRMLSYPRQQQYRRLARAGVALTLSMAAVPLVLLAAASGVPEIAAVLLSAAVGWGLYARHFARLAGRARVGAQSEDQVRRALLPLERDGWQLRQSLSWHGQGDVDSVAISPTGFAFAIETKTRNYTTAHLARVRDIAGWMTTNRRRWCRKGALPVLCVVRGRGLERVEADVLVVSIDRLPAALRTAARSQKRPAFLSPAGRRERRGDRLTPSRDSRSTGEEGRLPSAARRGTALHRPPRGDGPRPARAIRLER